MAETSGEIRRELELTRKRMGTTIAALERKVNPRHLLDDYPLAAVGVAFGTGVLIATTGAGGRAVHSIRDEVRHGAANVNNNASNAIDRIVQAITGAATTAMTAQVGALMDRAVNHKPKQNNLNEQNQTTRAA